MSQHTVFHGSPWIRALGAALLGALLTLAVTINGARAEASLPAAEIEKIHGVITAQLDAFKRDDAAAAFSYASHGIQEKMGSPEFFLELVRNQYPPVYRSKGIEFQEVVALDGSVGIIQPALVTGADDEQVLAVYTLELILGGNWRISGCLLYRIVPNRIET